MVWNESKEIDMTFIGETFTQNHQRMVAFYISSQRCIVVTLNTTIIDCSNKLRIIYYKNVIKPQSFRHITVDCSA